MHPCESCSGSQGCWRLTSSCRVKVKVDFTLDGLTVQHKDTQPLTQAVGILGYDQYLGYLESVPEKTSMNICGIQDQPLHSCVFPPPPHMTHEVKQETLKVF